MAEFLERSIYQEGSLRATREGFSFRLLNPPMRMGAFHWATLSVDQRPLPPEDCSVSEPQGPSLRPFPSLSRQEPLHLRPGEGASFAARLPGLVPGHRHTVQLNLRNVAIPPMVWVRFTDELRREEEG